MSVAASAAATRASVALDRQGSVSPLGGSPVQRPASSSTLLRPASGSIIVDSASAPDPQGFSWSLLSDSLPLADGATVDSWMASIDEHFIMKGDLQVATEGALPGECKNRTIVLTEESFIELKLVNPRVDPPALPPADSPATVQPTKEKKHKSLLEIHSIEVDPTDASTFLIHFFSGSASNRVGAGFSKVKRLLNVAGSFDQDVGLKTKVIRCHSPEECQQWVLVLDTLVRNLWQRTLESTMLPEPEVMKRHAFVIKQHNDRLIVISDSWFYNVDVTYKPVALRGIKWAIPISSLQSVTQLDSDASVSEGVLAISFDAEEAKKQFDAHHRSNKGGELRNKHHEFTFRTKPERQKFVNSLTAVYWQCTRKKLQIK